MLERTIRATAGLFVICSVTLSWLHHSYWLLFTLFVGANLFQSAFSGFCPLESVLRRLGVADSPSASDHARMT